MARQQETRESKPGDELLLLTECEAAQMLGFSHRTLQAWRVRGDGPQFVKVSSRCVRYRRADLEEWVRGRIRRSTSVSGEEAAAWRTRMAGGSGGGD